MAEQSQIIRGGPRYCYGAAAGPRGVIAWIPEVRVAADGQTSDPIGLIELLPDGVCYHPIPGRVPHRLARWPRPAAARPPARGADIAPSWLVQSAEAAAEDPRVAAAFGPPQEIAGGVQIPLARVRPARGPGERARTSWGRLEIAGGRVTVRPVRRVPFPPRPLGVAAGLLVALLWLLRKRLTKP